MNVKSMLLCVMWLGLCAVQARAENAELEPGLVAEYFLAPGSLNDFMKLDGVKPTYVRVDKAVNFGSVTGDFYGARMADNFHVRWTGVLKCEKDGKYEFATQSDDGSRLFIDDKLIVNNGGVHPATVQEGHADLKAGDHKIRVDFFQGGGEAECLVGWTVPSGKHEAIPAASLFHEKGTEKIDYDKVAWEKRPKGSDVVHGSAKMGKGGAGGGKGNAIHEKMDYGPFLSGTVESQYPSGGNYAVKGLAIKLGDKAQAAVSFDTELLRYSVAWTGEWLKLDYGRDGLEGHPTLRGTPRFGTKGGSVGWAKDDKWDDPRAKSTNGRFEGPLPADWAKYKGVYLDGRNVVLHYTVGDCDILEQPSFDDSDGLDVFARTLQVGVTKKPLTMLLLDDEKAEATSSAGGNTARLDFKDDAAILAGLHGAPAGTALALDGKRVLLKIPALTETATFTIKIANVKKADAAKFGPLVDTKIPTPNFAVTTKGGAPRWQPIETKGELNKSDAGAYAVDNITVPYENPYNSYMRLTGVDFFKDGRAAVCTMSGDVWIVSGIDDKLEKITWRRYASGLFATLGIKVVDDVVYTLGRDQITRFHDLNNDGEADYYESFNNDCTVSFDYHEFAHDLHTDSKGDFYYMKGSNLGGDGGKYHGTMVKVSKDGSTSEVYAVGFRAPNGMCVGPDDIITTGDNQGNWTPSSPINYIKKGGFYGHQENFYPATLKGPRQNPLCWIPYEEDNSCGGQVWGGPKWGPLSNHLLHMSYGKCKLFSVLIEKYNDDVQGGVVKFPLEFISGIMRGRVNPVDGQVYLAGMRGWQTAGVKDGILARVRYTGKPYIAPMDVKTANNGVTITFSEPLDKESVEDASNWDVRRFNVKYTSNYGSPEYSVDDPEKKSHREGDRSQRDVVEVKSVKLGEDGKTVKVEVASMKLCTNMIFSYKLKSKDGAKVNQDLDYTINFIPGGEHSPGMFPPEKKEAKKKEVKKEEKKAEKPDEKKDDKKDPSK